MGSDAQLRQAPRSLLLVIGLSIVLAILILRMEAAEAAGPQRPGDDLFATPKVLSISLRISEEARTSLRTSPRTWVEADAEIDRVAFPHIRVRLKGNTSFLPVDEKPSFTLDFKRGPESRRLDGLSRIHLNNSVQDFSYLCEYLASDLFRRAGVPAARVAWAKVTLNDRDLGLFVLKESLDDDFLDRHFGRHDGNFYDGGKHHEIDEPLEKDSGKGPDNHSDLQALHCTTLQPDPQERWRELNQLLDTERFISMLAMETLTAHIDGYSAMQNNYRIHLDAVTGKATFIVHGMDRMFEVPEWPIPIQPRGIVSLAVLDTPEGLRLYRQRIRELSPLLSRDWVKEQIGTLINILGPAEPLMVGKAKGLEARLLERILFIERTAATAQQSGFSR